MPNNEIEEWHITKVLRQRRFEKLRDQQNENDNLTEGPPAQFLSYSQGKRMFYGLLWTFWTVLFVYVGFALLSGGAVPAALVAFVLMVLAGNYAWRIWSWQAKNLWFFIIF
jgi:hypothetical protein